jgi:hypothetical protein
MPLRREAANLSRMRSPASSRSNWAPPFTPMTAKEKRFAKEDRLGHRSEYRKTNGLRIEMSKRRLAR